MKNRQSWESSLFEINAKNIHLFEFILFSGLFCFSLVAAGCAGEDDANGADGVDGSNALVVTSEEPPGENCANGGVKIQSGIDADNDGALDDSEINAALTKYICSGAPSDNATFVLSKNSLTTSEDGTSDSLTVKLSQAPTADVILPVMSTNTAEGAVSPASLTFTPANWDIAQTVTVTGQNDYTVDGDAYFYVTFGPAVSNDVAFSGASGFVLVKNVVDDSVGDLTLRLLCWDAVSHVSDECHLYDELQDAAIVRIYSGDTKIMEETLWWTQGSRITFLDLITGAYGYDVYVYAADGTILYYNTGLDEYGRRSGEYLFDVYPNTNTEYNVTLIPYP